MPAVEAEGGEVGEVGDGGEVGEFGAVEREGGDGVLLGEGGEVGQGAQHGEGDVAAGGQGRERGQLLGTAHDGETAPASREFAAQDVQAAGVVDADPGGLLGAAVNADGQAFLPPLESEGGSPSIGDGERAAVGDPLARGDPAGGGFAVGKLDGHANEGVVLLGEVRGDGAASHQETREGGGQEA